MLIGLPIYIELIRRLQYLKKLGRVSLRCLGEIFLQEELANNRK